MPADLCPVAEGPRVEPSQDENWVAIFLPLSPRKFPRKPCAPTRIHLHQRLINSGSPLIYGRNDEFRGWTLILKVGRSS
jgi:hypothetical protein